MLEIQRCEIMYSKSVSYAKVIFTYEYIWQNFRLRLLCLVNRLRSNSQDAKVVNESFAMCIHRWIMLYLRPQLLLHFIYVFFQLFWSELLFQRCRELLQKSIYLHGVGSRCLLLLPLFQFLFIHCLFVSHVSHCRMDCSQSNLIHERMLPVSSCIIRKT